MRLPKSLFRIDCEAVRDLSQFRRPRTSPNTISVTTKDLVE